MKQKRNMWAMFVMMISGSVGAYEIQYRHTLVKMLGGENNQISLTILDDGTIKTQFPTYAPHAKNGADQLEAAKWQHMSNQIQHLIQAKINPNVQRKLAVIKSGKSDLFYSSESDQLSLEVFDGGQLLWSIDLNNFHELEHHYDQLGEWQVLVDVIRSLNRTLKESKIKLMRGES